jgi:hypothetical protein
MALPAQQPQKAVPAKLQLQTVSSEDLPFWSALRMAIIAPPGEGKTHLCVTASAQYKEGEPCVLDDIYLVETDPLGIAGLKERKITVPRMLDLTTSTDEEMSRIFMDLPKFLAAEAKKAPTRLVAVDTGSVLLGAVCTIQVKQHDGPRAYNEFARIVRSFYSKCKAIEAPLVFTMHVRPPRVIMGPNGQFVTDSATAAGIKAGALTMDIEGNKGANVIRGVNTLTGRLQKVDLPGGKSNRVLKFESSTDETKRRFTKCVDKEEPADLGKLLAKIAAGCDVPMPGGTK